MRSAFWIGAALAAGAGAQVLEYRPSAPAAALPAVRVLEPGASAEAPVQELQPASSSPVGESGPSAPRTGAQALPSAPAAALLTANPILFVTQVPRPGELEPVTASFGNHLGGPEHAGRGGDLWIRYEDGSLRNLTLEAGFGEPGVQQGSRSIAVREPCVHWSGARALFSMVSGAPVAPDFHDADATFFWQIYEISRFAKGQKPVIKKVAFQPKNKNNVSPVYGSDGAIFFMSDRTRTAAEHLYPQLDEYEQRPTTTGVWRLDPQSGELSILNHLPSGAFGLSVDSSGRVVFTRWDHLERDQQVHLYMLGKIPQQPFNYSTEAANSVPTPSMAEIFPEPQYQWIDYVNAHPGYSGDLAGWKPWLVGHKFDAFLPWSFNQDGTDEETLIHVGRHELFGAFPRSRNDDPALEDHDLASLLEVDNDKFIVNAFQLREDPTESGSFYAINAPRHRAQTSGQLVRLRGLGSGDNPNQSVVDYLTSLDTFGAVATPAHTGRYRNPLPMTDGQVLVSHSPYPDFDTNLGSFTAPKSPHEFRLSTLVFDGSYYRADAKLTPGIAESVAYYAEGKLVTWSGVLWELDAVEVYARPAPPLTSAPPKPPLPEMQILAQEQVSLPELVSWLEANQLALIVSRNVTSRDANDEQQPYNLRIAGGGAQTIGSPGDPVYDLAHLRIYQADQRRSLSLSNGVVRPGRRVLATPMHNLVALAMNPKSASTPLGAVTLAPDGSMAALVPARRALTWETVDPAGNSIVRERYWLTFQPGEIRSCASCHGLNEKDQAGNPPPQNPPEALRTLISNLRAAGAIH